MNILGSDCEEILLLNKIWNMGVIIIVGSHETIPKNRDK